ncbi:CPBP family intramembrane glutamic endopeptidase [Pareuzebyella sediminis]|uniref:CPBP family intramembrane glutamic endopeptidase n=1 Tax=Pareuzebyella sediminis TaxID=2607998 RepID=UPI0011ED28F8|nr:CPBP family intramembrane glutamic endopeptidase [Pareuzebyella sediminis]
MTGKKILLGIILILIGMIGIASILTMDIPLPSEVEAILKDKFTAGQIKLLTLINPTILLVILVVIGTILYQKVNLKVPIIEKLIGIRKESIETTSILKYGLVGGILSGILLSLVSFVFNPIVPAEFLELRESLQPTLAARFLYGGLTEEIVMRFGLMTLIIWLCSKIFKGTKPFVFWIGIVLSAILFAFGHFPIAYQAVDHPTTGLLAYILIGNSLGGIIFGWLYWKKGLESAFIAHIFTHIIMVFAEQFSI